MTHPMGRNRGSKSRSRKYFTLLVLGLMLGIVVYVLFGETERINTDSDIAAENVDGTFNSVAAGSTITAAPVSNIQTERRIYFPNAETAGLIVEAYRKPGGWDVADLQNLVGHLEGTPWLGERGNIVLAGHFEDELGRPGPFRYLYFAEVGDRILLQDGSDSVLHIYEVTDVFHTDPTDLEVLRKSETPKLTLITCDDWSYETEVYEQRLVVVAVPVGTSEDLASARAPR